jgi:hypothetical protein
MQDEVQTLLPMFITIPFLYILRSIMCVRIPGSHEKLSKFLTLFEQVRYISTQISEVIFSEWAGIAQSV